MPNTSIIMIRKGSNKRLAPMFSKPKYFHYRLLKILSEKFASIAIRENPTIPHPCRWTHYTLNTYNSFKWLNIQWYVFGQCNSAISCGKCILLPGTHDFSFYPQFLIDKSLKKKTRCHNWKVKAFLHGFFI